MSTDVSSELEPSESSEETFSNDDLKLHREWGNGSDDGDTSLEEEVVPYSSSKEEGGDDSTNDEDPTDSADDDY
jgi:hypothetical protein